VSKTDFVSRLHEDAIPLEQILLDPNNPRLVGLEDYNGVPEQRIAEEEVQIRTLARLNDNRAIDQESLRASIEQSGLLPVDRVVVRPANLVDTEGRPLYVVVEGNRRIAACKTLLAQHKLAEKTLDPAVKGTIELPKVLLLEEGEAEEARLHQWVIQGVRHISGLKPWGAYQSAKTIEAMLEKLGYSEQEVAGALSISIQRVRRSMRVLGALRQMAESDDFSEYAGPHLYAYFDEVLKRPKVRQWLLWSNDSLTFEDDDRLTRFYTWITPDDELDGGRRVPVAESVRKLDEILEDAAALAVLDTAGKTVDDAARVAMPTAAPNWTEPLERALHALDAVPIGDLEELTDENRDLVQRLIETASKRLKQADTFRA
jgi:hypothetical protein